MKRFFILSVFLIIGTLLTQGFQCASPEMTTAKVAIQNKDWSKAENYLQKELDKNPQNTEAWLEMFKVKKAMGKLNEAAQSLVYAEKSNPVDLKYRDQISLNGYQLWVKCYNDGVAALNKYQTTKDRKYVDTSITCYDIGSTIRPEIVEFYRLKGRTYEDIGDTNKAVEEYIKYKNAIEKDLPFISSKKLFKNVSREEVVAMYGNPIESRGLKATDADSSIVDYYKIENNAVYLSFTEKNKGTFQIDGWKINPPSIWMDGEKFQYIPLDVSPIGSLAQIAFNRKDYKKALEYTDLIIKIEPNNTEANGFLIQIYDIQGKRDDALKTVQKLVEANPNNKFYIAQYGEMLFKLEQYPEAIAQFEKALKIDPNFYTVQRNIAACYKNKAVIKQREQQDKKDKDKNYKLNPDEYTKDLIKSAEFFEKSRESKDFKMDFNTLKELANLYDVLERNNNLMQISRDLEKIESSIPDNQKETYWYSMVKIYSNLKQNEKLKKAMEEAEKFKK